MFALNRDLLRLRNHFLASGRNSRHAKSKLARTKKPTTRETAEACDRDASGAARGLGSGTQCVGARGAVKRLRPRSSSVSG